MSKAGVTGVLIFLVVMAIIAIWIVAEQQHSASLIEQGCKAEAWNLYGQPTLWTCPSNVDPGPGFVPGFMIPMGLATEEEEEREKAKTEEENCCAYADPIRPDEEDEEEEKEKPEVIRTDPIRPEEKEIKEGEESQSENITTTNNTQQISGLDYCWKVNENETVMIVTECPIH